MPECANAKFCAQMIWTGLKINITGCFCQPKCLMLKILLFLAFVKVQKLDFSLKKAQKIMLRKTEPSKMAADDKIFFWSSLSYFVYFCFRAGRFFFFGPSDQNYRGDNQPGADGHLPVEGLGKKKHPQHDAGDWFQCR